MNPDEAVAAQVAPPSLLRIDAASGREIEDVVVERVRGDRPDVVAEVDVGPGERRPVVVADEDRAPFLSRVAVVAVAEAEVVVRAGVDRAGAPGVEENGVDGLRDTRGRPVSCLVAPKEPRARLCVGTIGPGASHMPWPDTRPDPRMVGRIEREGGELRCGVRIGGRPGLSAVVGPEDLVPPGIHSSRVCGIDQQGVDAFRTLGTAGRRPGKAAVRGTEKARSPRVRSRSRRPRSWKDAGGRGRARRS